MKRRGFALLLAMMLLMQWILPCQAAETGTEEKEGDYEIGKLWVYTEDGGKRQVRAALYADETILAEPETIADIAGVTCTQYRDRYEFRRGNYAVYVMAGESRAKTRLYLDNGQAIPLYSNKKFGLEEIRTLDLSGEKKVFLPLEKMLYLLNVQWTCSGKVVYCYSPVETLWNVVGDTKKLVECIPQREEIIGYTGWEQVSNSFMYGVLAYGDELSVWNFVPIIGDRIIEKEDLEKAMLALAVPCENITDSLRSDAEQAASGFMNDLGGCITDIASLGGTGDVVDLMSKSFTSWSEIQLPSDIGTIFAGIDVFGDNVKAFGIAARYQDWTQGYVKQLKYLTELETDEYPDYRKMVRSAAESLYSEYGNLLGNQIWETAKVLGFNFADVLIARTPAGAALSGYNAAAACMKANIPAAANAFESGQHAATAMELCRLAELLRSEYALVHERRDGNAETLQDLEEIRRCGKLLASISAHSHDALYSSLRAMLLETLGSDATEEQIRSYTVMGKSMNALAQKLIVSQNFVLRFQETEQFDRSLLIINSFANLYSDTAGMHREKIPPEYVLIDPLMRFPSGMGEYGGVIYKIGNALEKDGISIQTLPVETPKYDRIHTFLFYRGRLYFCCKDGGTSDFNSALYSCEPDGSDMTLLKEGCPDFYIDNNRLYLWGPEYLDLMDGQWKYEDSYSTPGFGSFWEDEAFRLDCLDEDGMKYIPIEEQPDGTRLYRHDQERLLVPMDNRFYQIQIQTVAKGMVFFTYYEDSNAMLYCCDIESGRLALLDQKRAAGSGSYFGW